METRHLDISKETKINSIKVWKGLQICIQIRSREEAKIIDVSIRPTDYYKTVGRWKSNSHKMSINTPKPPFDKKQTILGILEHFSI